MKLRWILLISLCTLAACGRPPEPATVGEADFKGFGCIRCHRVGNEGGTYGPDLTLVGFRKSKDWLNVWLKNPHAWKPTTVMPNFHLPDQVRQDLIEYLSQQQGQAWGDTRPWDAPELQGDLVQKGEVIFNRAGCVACHGLRGAGGYPNNNVQGGKINTLTLVADGYSKDELKDRIHKGKISDPADPTQPKPMIFMPPWGQKLKDSDIDALVEFLYSLRPKPAAKDTW